eukprot:777113-Lingulodinium_polyedra.AAC.1
MRDCVRLCAGARGRIVKCARARACAQAFAFGGAMHWLRSAGQASIRAVFDVVCSSPVAKRGVWRAC